MVSERGLGGRDGGREGRPRQAGIEERHERRKKNMDGIMGMSNHDIYVVGKGGNGLIQHMHAALGNSTNSTSDDHGASCLA